MESDEPADELPTFCFQHSDNNFTSGILQFLYASARNLRKRVPAPDDDAWNLLLDDEVCTRRSFAIVRTRFQADIDGGTFQQGRVFHGTDGVDLGVRYRMHTSATTGVTEKRDSLNFVRMILCSDTLAGKTVLLIVV